MRDPHRSALQLIAIIGAVVTLFLWLGSALAAGTAATAQTGEDALAADSSAAALAAVAVAVSLLAALALLLYLLASSIAAGQRMIADRLGQLVRIEHDLADQGRVGALRQAAPLPGSPPA